MEGFSEIYLNYSIDTLYKYVVFSSCTIKNLTELLDPSNESRLPGTHHLLSIGGGASCVIDARHTLVQLVQFGGDASGGRDGAGGIGWGGQAVGQESTGRLVALG